LAFVEEIGNDDYVIDILCLPIKKKKQKIKKT